MKRERDDTTNDQPTSAPASFRHGDEATEDADPGIARSPSRRPAVRLPWAPQLANRPRKLAALRFGSQQPWSCSSSWSR